MVRWLIEAGRWIAAALLPIVGWVVVSSAVEPALQDFWAANHEWVQATIVRGEAIKTLPPEKPIWPQATFFIFVVGVMAATGLLARKDAEPVHLCNLGTVSMVALLLCAAFDYISGDVTFLRVLLSGLFGFLLATLIWLFRRRKA